MLNPTLIGPGRRHRKCDALGRGSAAPGHAEGDSGAARAPTFDVLIKIQDRQRLLIHHSVAEAVDALLRGRPQQAELRYRDTNGSVHSERITPLSLEERLNGHVGGSTNEEAPDEEQDKRALGWCRRGSALQPVRILPYGITRDRLERAARRMHLPVHVVRDMAQAQVLLTTKGFYRKRPRLMVDAERRALPIYVLRANTASQMDACLSDMFDLENQPADPMRWRPCPTEEAIQQVRAGASEVELAPQQAHVRRRQHELARAANLASSLVGEDPARRVCIHRED